MPKGVKIYGTIHNIQYRSVLAVFEKMDLKFKEELVEVMDDQHKDPKYTVENPS